MAGNRVTETHCLTFPVKARSFGLICLDWIDAGYSEEPTKTAGDYFEGMYRSDSPAVYERNLLAQWACPAVGWESLGVFNATSICWSRRLVLLLLTLKPFRCNCSRSRPLPTVPAATHSGKKEASLYFCRDPTLPLFYRSPNFPHGRHLPPSESSPPLIVPPRLTPPAPCVLKCPYFWAVPRPAFLGFCIYLKDCPSLNAPTLIAFLLPGDSFPL
jgi:hypothetical protein